MKDSCEVAIVGGGASGLLCAGMLGEAGIPVMVFEKNNKVGKKLLATGNGRCNFTNVRMDTDFFYGDSDWLSELLPRYGPEYVIRRFHALGVYHKVRDGYVYPYTNQAVTVVDALYEFCHRSSVNLVTDCAVLAVGRRKGQNGFYVRTSQGECHCRFLILATGGRASGELGGSGSGYKLARSLGHRVNPVYPGLTGLICDGDWWKRVAGTRIQGAFSLLVNDRYTAGECGEIQVAKNGVSGIPVFQLCREAAMALDAGKRVEGVIDFVPSMEAEEVEQWVKSFGLAGLVPKKWVSVLQSLLGTERELKAFTVPVCDTFGLERAQVTAGGVSTEEVLAGTMESKLVPDVFFLGELLDVDGKCGGYNLHFAWISAMAAADELIQRKKGINRYAADVTV